jgi:hypothetical protein
MKYTIEFLLYKTESAALENPSASSEFIHILFFHREVFEYKSNDLHIYICSTIVLLSIVLVLSINCFGIETAWTDPMGCFFTIIILNVSALIATNNPTSKGDKDCYGKLNLFHWFCCFYCNSLYADYL